MTEEKFKADFTERLRRARSAEGLTQMQLAEEVDVAANTITYWENGMRVGHMPNAYCLRRICETLHVTADWLLFGKEEVK